MKFRTLTQKISLGNHTGSFILSLIVLLGLGLRLFLLDRYPLQYDEVASLPKTNLREAFALSLNIATFRPMYAYNLLLGVWQLLGHSEFILRLLSVLTGTFTIIVFYFLSLQAFGRKSGLVAAFLLAIAPFHVHYSQELTVYVAVLFFSACSAWFMFRLLSGMRNIDCAGFIVCATVNVYFHHMSFILLIGQSICLFLLAKKKIKAVFCCGIMLFFLLPWFYVMFRQSGMILRYSELSRNISPFLNTVNIMNIFNTIFNFLCGYHSVSVVRFCALVWFVFILIPAFVRAGSEVVKNAFLSLVLIFFPMLLLLFFAGYRVMYSDRYVISGSLFLLLLAASGISKLKPAMRAGALIIYALLCSFSLRQYYADIISLPGDQRPGINHKYEFRAATDYILDNYSPGDVLLHFCEVSALPVQYYFLGAQSPSLAEQAPLIASWYFEHQGGSSGLLQETDNKLKVYVFNPAGRFDSDFVEQRRRVWLVYSFFGETPPDWGETCGPIFKDYSLQVSRQFKGIGVYLFTR